MKYKKTISKPKKTLSKVKKKYEKPLLKNKKILDIVVKEYKETLSADSNKEEKTTKNQELKIPKTSIPKASCDDFIDKTEKIITKQLKIPQTNMLEIFVVCIGSLYNKVFINE